MVIQKILAQLDFAAVCEESSQTLLMIRLSRQMYRRNNDLTHIVDQIMDEYRSDETIHLCM